MASSPISADTRRAHDPIIVDALGVTVAVTGLNHSALAGFHPGRRAVDVSAVADDPLVAITELTRVAVERTRLLCVHAGVVHDSRGAIAFPGKSGLGKSTLTAALVRAGFGYMSDEVLAVDHDGLTHAFPRPITLDTAARHLLGIGGRNFGEVAVLASELGSVGPSTASLSRVVLLERVAAGPASLSSTDRSEAVASLVANSVNCWRDARASLALIVRAVSSAEVWRVRYSDATELAQLLHGQFTPGEPKPSVRIQPDIDGHGPTLHD